MFSENFIGKPKNTQGLKEVEKAEEQNPKEEDIGPVTEGDFLALQAEGEQKRRENSQWLAERVPEFLSAIDECVVNFHAQHQDREKDSKQKADLQKYNSLVIKVTDALKMFLTNIKDNEFVEVLEHDIATISGLCREAYVFDDSFPNFAFIDEKKFLEACKESLRKKLFDEQEEIKIEFKIGRFSVIKTGLRQTFLLDQQAELATKNEISSIEKPRNNAVVVKLFKFMHTETRLFSGRTGKFSEEMYRQIGAGVGELWVGVLGNDRFDDNFVILDKDGNQLYRLYEYVPNKDKTRALVRFLGHSNVLLGDGKLLFDTPKDDNYDNNKNVRVHATYKNYEKDQLAGNIIFEQEGRFVKLNKDLEIMAEGASLEEVNRKAIA